jgi:two-component system OmpR family sensor kinase
VRRQPGPAPTPTPGLRLRVGVIVLALVTAVLVALFAFVNLTLSARLHSDLRARLVDRAGFAKLIQDSVSSQEMVNRLTGDGVTARLVTGSGELTGVNEPRPAPPRGGRPPSPPAPADATVTTSGNQLTVTTPVRGGDLVLSASQADISAAIHRLFLLEVIGAASALALLAAALYGTLGFALRPLARMTTVATDIAGGARGRRLRASHPRTDLGQTAHAFDAMLDELEKAVTDARDAEIRLRDFLSDVSHELRTPVAGVSASAELLLTAELSPQVREQLTEGLVTQSQRIARLLDDLLLSARLAQPSSALHLQPLELRQLLATQVAQAQLLAPDLQVHLELGRTDGPVLVVADAQRLAQILTNLLDNARHATPPGGVITVGVDVGVDAGGDTVIVTVSDSGIGVAPEQRERIFDRFVRLDPRSTGTGLGLMISRAVAQGHGGSLRCTQPSATGGAQFVLTLPALPAGTRAGSERAVGTMIG